MPTPTTTSPIQQASEDVRQLVGMSSTIGTIPVNPTHRAIVRAHSNETISRMAQTLSRAIARLYALQTHVCEERDYRARMEARSNQAELPLGEADANGA